MRKHTLRHTLAFLVPLLLLSSPGCEECSNIKMPSASVEVVDDATSEQLCDANVEVAVIEVFKETLTVTSAKKPCRYEGAVNRSGLFKITADKAGYEPASQTLWVSSNGCHVNTAVVTLRLKKP